MAYIHTYNNDSFEYMSNEFKIKYMHLCISIYKKYINKPREEVINKLIKFWPKWDIYSQNVMFIKLIYSIVIKGNNEYDMKGGKNKNNNNNNKNNNNNDKKDNSPYNEENSNMNISIKTPLPPLILNEMFETKTLKLKSYYFLKDNKILDILEFMMWNIHPDPEKRLLPEEAKDIFNTLFYDC